MNKRLIIVLVLVLALVLAACDSPQQQAPAPEAPGGTEPAAPGGDTGFPSRNIDGIVMWGAGGGTDSLMRPLSALAEEHLGVSVVVQNMTGAVGSIATQFVWDTTADGYTLLMGAENPALYQALQISDLTYADFDAVFLVGDETVGIVVRPDSPHATFTDLINAALENPGSMTISTTGAGGLPWTVSSFIYEVTGATFNQIPYDSDASAILAVLNGEVEFTVAKVQSAIEHYQAGNVNFLTMLSLDTVPTLPDVPLVTAEYPDFANFLPWGPFYGVFVRQGTDPAVIAALSQAFSAAAADPSYQQLLVDFNINFLGYTGQQAQDWIAAWQTNTVTALENSGALADVG